MAQPTYTLEELSRKVDAISEFLNEKTDRNLLNLNTVGQAIIDGKVEVEALLKQNGYAKFTWKEGNKLSILFQWGYPTSQVTNFAMAFKKILGGSTCIVGQHNFNGQIAHTVLLQLTNTRMNVIAEIANGPTANVPYIYVLVGQ